jgi:type IV fimbrial biogenesis protein FimT
MLISHLKRHRQEQLGFSLVELMIVVVIFGVLAAFAVPSYQQMIQNSQIKTATEAIVTGFQVARGEAVSRNTSVQLELGASNSSAWSVCLKPTPAGACKTADIIQTRLASDGSSDKITATPTPAGGRYVFNGFGVMTSPTSSVTINVASTDTSVSSRNLRIVVGAGGAVRSCDPALDASGTDPRRC